MKKSLMISMICILSLALSGCSIETKNHIFRYTNKKGFSYAAKSWYDKILPALNDGKTEMVYRYFCQKLRNKTTKEEIKQIIKQVKHKIQKYDIGELHLRYRSSDEEQITVEDCYYVMNDICSNTGEKYIMEIDFYETNTKKPDLVGMTCIKLFDVTENEEAYPADPQYTAGDDGIE